MTKEQILAGIKKCARKLRRTPTVAEIRRMTGITQSNIRKHFTNVKKAFSQAGMEARGPGYPVDTLTLLEDWGRVTRKLGQPPTFQEYGREGQYGATRVLVRCGGWSRVGERFQAEMAQRETEKDWLDVLAIIKQWQGNTTPPGRRRIRDRRPGQPVVPDQPHLSHKIIPGRPVYGPPSKIAGMRNEPTNECGVMFAFGRVAEKLGFEVERIQTAFPDCEALREVAKDKWQRVKIEFEYASRNFLDHGHSPKGCDIIVCWIHNWQECPKHLEVIELRRMVRGM